MHNATSRPWVSSLLVVGVGALVVFALVALLLPSSATDPSHLKGEALAGATIGSPLEISTTGSSDVEVARLTIPPGGDGGWHQHNGYVLVTVSSGTASFYDRDDPSCASHRYVAGDGVLEVPNHPHITRNESDQPLVLMIVAITPSGQHSDKDMPASPHCRF
jgi:quercetin dioxygenase-like cupin family protein